MNESLNKSAPRKQLRHKRWEMKTKDWKADRKDENKCSLNWEDTFLAPPELLSHTQFFINTQAQKHAMPSYTLRHTGSALNISALNRWERLEKSEAEMFCRNHHSPPAYLQQPEPAQRRSSTQTADTSFWLPGAFHSSTPAIYTRRTH